MDYINRDYFNGCVITGVDAKLLQYDTQSIIKSTDQIDLTNIIESSISQNKTLKKFNNCVLINIEKDIDRYNSAIEELKKISFFSIVHLKATYWKNREDLENDLTFILKFLNQFNKSIDIEKIKIDLFSNINDNNINIQDGPLACYCSHVRAMIYGYLNFNDYTIIIEDDLSIINTENIEKYIKCIPDDWDVVCMNSAPKNITYNEPYYKFTDEFHSGHFYIIKNKSLEIIFKNIYPITDQIDVLMSNLHNTLNIYNIPNTVYQKSYSTNTQNNLHTIFTSPNYCVVTQHIEYIKLYVDFFTQLILPENEQNNKLIVNNLIDDILFTYIIDSNNQNNINNINNIDETDGDNPALKYKEYDEYKKMFHSIAYVIQCTKKGIDVVENAYGLLHNFLKTLLQFNLHNTCDEKYGEPLKAYNYGSSAHTYLLKKNKIIIKVYDSELRWKCDNHDNINEIFNKEKTVLNNQNIIKLYDFDEINKIIKMEYMGLSLYDNFYLPEDWKEQIHRIFDEFTKNNIFYPEFRLQNILVYNERISFIDFGLTNINDVVNNVVNNNNCMVFIELLSLLDDKFKYVLNHEKRNILYHTLINNIKVHKIKKYIDNIF